MQGYSKGLLLDAKYISPDQGKYKTNFQILRADSLRKWVLSK